MDRESQFHKLIADLHGAALEPALWQPALQAVVQIFDVRAAHFFLWDSARARVPFSVCESPASCSAQIESALAAYTSHYASLDYRRDLTDSAVPGTWMHCHEWTTPRALAKNEFFSDFLRPANLRWLSGMRITYAPTASAYIGFSRGFDQSPMEGSALHMLNLLAPHLATASRNFFAAAELRSVARQGLACLDAWPAALLFLDRQARPTFVNQHATELLTAARVFRVRRGVLVAANDSRCTNQLHEAVRRAITLGQPSHFLLSQGAGAGTFTATVLPLRADAVHGAGTLEPKALLVVNGLGQTPRAGALRELFGLTPREAELAVALLNGSTPAAIAAHRGVSLATVRTQIRSLFTKTGTNRLPALIRALATAAPMPFEH